MKLDPERGAEDLKTFSRLCQFFGAIIYCIIGGAVYEYTPRGPQNFYWFSFIVGVAILGSAFITLPVVKRTGSSVTATTRKLSKSK